MRAPRDHQAVIKVSDARMTARATAYQKHLRSSGSQRAERTGTGTGTGGRG